jgi:hypothetical protein
VLRVPGCGHRGLCGTPGLMQFAHWALEMGKQWPLTVKKALRHNL